MSIILAAYNAETYIGKAIASVLQQQFADWELVVVDDGSDDWTYPIACSSCDQRVRVYCSVRNRGKTLAMHLGLEQCRGMYVLELDADDWLESDCLAVLVSAMNEQPEEVAMLYGRRAIYRELNKKAVFHRLEAAPVIKDKLEMLTYLQGIGPRFYRRQHLQSVGSWQVEPWSNGFLYEDLSVILRLLEKYQIKYISYTGYNVLKHSQNITYLNRRRWWKTMKRMVPYFLHRWGDKHVAHFDERNRKVTLLEKHDDNNTPS